MYLVMVYGPPNGNITRAIENLTNFLKFIPNQDKSDIIIGGDFNIDFSKSRKENTKKLKHFSSKHNLTQHIKDPTRSEDSSSVIDLIFAKCNYVKHSGILSWNLSDHTPVYILIKKDKTQLEKPEFMGRSYRNVDQQIF